MSSIDPIKSKPIGPAFTPPEPPKTSDKKSTATPVDHAYSGPAPQLGGIFGPAAPPPLSGPGVMATVFGPTFPNPGKLSDGELAKGLEGLDKAIRKNPGKANDADLKLWGALVSEAARRSMVRLGSTAPAESLSNRELFGQLLAFDAAEAAGKPLSADQKKRQQELTATFEKRGKLDLDGEIAYFQSVRAQAKSDMALHCAATGAGAFGLATHVDTPAMLASAAVIWAKYEQGKTNQALLEGSLFIAGRLPFAHKAAEITSTVLNAGECATAAQEFIHAGHLIHQFETTKKSQEAKAR